ncbi:MAG: choice-of-anchor V domain-containing protein [Flavobacteriia bacterium]|jgi:hypothetical protein
MKKNYLFIMLAATTLGGLAFTNMSKELKISKYAVSNSHKNSNGGPAGKSGAPGESTCTDCHSGSVQDGAGINQLGLFDANQNAVTEYTPGETYTVGITTEAASKRGFQVTPRILSSNAQAGTSTGISFVSSVQSQGNQQYINHNSTSNTSASGWLFTWTAPATDVGDVRFYLATNITNNQGNTGGDVIRTSQHTFSAAASSASISEQTKTLNLAVGFVKQNNALELNYSSLQAGSGFLNLVDMSGKSVHTTKINTVNVGENHETVFLPSDLKEGIYIVNFFVNNNSVSKKIMISK